MRGTVLSPILVPSFDAIVAWWNSPIGMTPPVLYLTGSSPAAKSSVLDAFIDDLAELNKRLPAGRKVDWIRVKPADAAAGEGMLGPWLEELRAASMPETVTEEPGRRANHVIIIDDDVPDGDGLEFLGQAIRDVPSANRAGLRFIVGVTTAPADAPAEAIRELPYLYPRDVLLNRISSWAEDPRTGPVMLVRGRPGSGKTELLCAAVRHFAADPELQLAYHLLKSPTSLARFEFEDLVSGIAQVLKADGLLLGNMSAAGPEIQSTVNTGEIHERATVTATRIDQMTIGRTLLKHGELRALLDRRAEQGSAQRPLLIVIDSLDELAQADWDAVQELVALITPPRQLRAWNVKVLVSLHGSLREVTPGIPEPDEVIDLDSDDQTALDLAAYVERQLEFHAFDRYDREFYSQRIAELSGGLFIVASGYLHELKQELGTTPAVSISSWLAQAPPVRSAADYFALAITRLLAARTTRDGQVSQESINMERFLRILALTPLGMTAAEMAGVWAADLESAGIAAPGSADWWYLAEQIPTSKAAHYFVIPRDERKGRYRLIHPSVREALLRSGSSDDATYCVKPAHSGITLNAERRRFIRALTPADGGGPFWDPAGGRLALATVMDVIADMLVDAFAGSPPDDGTIGLAREMLCTTLEDWKWLEICLIHYRPDDEIPLGVGAVVDMLGRLSKVAGPGFDSNEPFLWTGEEWTEEWVPPVEVTERDPDRPADERTPRTAPASTRPLYLSAQTMRGVELISGNEIRRTREEALARLHELAAEFTTANPPIGSDNPDEPVFWIQDYGLTPEDSERGFRGHYARLTVQPAPGGDWAIQVEKVPVELTRHPSHGRPRRPNPDWGDLRGVEGHPSENGQPWYYSTRAKAEARLKSLKREFPSTILHDGVLYLMVWEKARRRASRYRLQIKPSDKGYFLSIRLNEQARGERDHGRFS